MRGNKIRYEGEGNETCSVRDMGVKDNYTLTTRRKKRNMKRYYEALKMYCNHMVSG